MKKYFVILQIGFLFSIILGSATGLKAQVSCANSTLLWLENFGSGTTSTTNPDVLPSGLTYEPLGPLTSEGTYRVINNTQQKPEWQASSDHTGNTNGKMLVVNGQAETFYRHVVTNTHGFTPGKYSVSVYLMNVDSLGICSPNPLLPIPTFTIEYLSESNVWVSLSGSPYTAAPVPQTVSPTWVNSGSTFTLPATGAFFPTQIRITIGDGTVGGCGNDFAMDDVTLALCPEGAPMPVQLVNFTAHEKGDGVMLEWSTSQELNNQYFSVERSADGNSNWFEIAKVEGSGNSQVAKNYTAFDKNPLAGNNYYRLKQVDYNGNYEYSRIINIKVNGSQSSISVLTNPFHGSLSVNIQSAIPQNITASLIDITGKQIATEKWSVSNGNSRKDFSNSAGLQPGMYILRITNNSGAVLYNGKAIKQ